jgi:hypothetical protein
MVLYYNEHNNNSNNNNNKHAMRKYLFLPAGCRLRIASPKFSIDQVLHVLIKTFFHS